MCHQLKKTKGKSNSKEPEKEHKHKAEPKAKSKSRSRSKEPEHIKNLQKARKHEDPYGIGHKVAIQTGAGKPNKKKSNPLPYNDIANDNYIIKF